MKARSGTLFAAIAVAGGVLLTTAGCKTRPAQARQSSESRPPSPTICPDFSDVDPRQVVMLILDRSQSIKQNHQDQLTEIREDASRVVRQLPPATRVFVRSISEKSYLERSLSSVIPDEPPSLHCPPFDLRCRRAEVLSAYPRSQRFVVIYSDLIDNVGLRLPSQLPGLANATVIVRMVKNEDPAPLAERVLAVSKRLAKLGASVQSISSEVPIDGSIFVQSPLTGNTLTASH